ncbi:MAG TPA: histidine kinase, partial [Actinopolymorphaceae bacterium]
MEEARGRMTRPSRKSADRGDGVGDGDGSFVARSATWWHTVTCVLLVLAAIVIVADPTDRTITALALGLLGLIAGAYFLVGRSLMMRAESHGRLTAFAYLTVVCGATLALSSLLPVGYILLFLAFSHVWTILRLRESVVVSCALTFGIVLLQIARSGWTSEAWLSGLSVGAGTAALGVLMGWWITGIVEESEQRRALIAELERTRAELGDAQHRAGALSERERLAAEIHDTLAQGFMSILVQTQAIDPDDSGDVRARVERIERTARDNLAEARSLIEALQPAELREHSLADACRRLCERFDAETGVTTAMDIDGAPSPLPANSEVVLLRAMQEALTNVRKHASADHVQVTLTYAE